MEPLNPGSDIFIRQDKCTFSKAHFYTLYYAFADNLYLHPHFQYAFIHRYCYQIAGINSFIFGVAIIAKILNRKEPANSQRIYLRKAAVIAVIRALDLRLSFTSNI
ncbi:hypothetical protein [Foetidibacter luteolus]|uniref:hypothetical protein n=1 Tax=Foetidibacter luteolus TaxID=2608880 RepID=UPI00129A1F79|nr:hypothetical protein [Foetidibacter luteolus]